MKNFVIFILSFFICVSVFAQDMVEKQYFENHPELGGDVLIKSSSFKVEKDEIFKTFEVESPEEGVYYMDAWIEAPVTEGVYPEYKVAVNGVLSEFTFKPQSDGWQSLPLTDAKKSVIAVFLKKGENSISVIGKKPIVPDIEIIKLSSDISKTGIPDANYKKLVESIKSNTLRAANNASALQAASASPSGTAGEIYDYYLNIPVNYTTSHTFSFSAGERVKIIGLAGSPSAIELFSTTNPQSYSWSANSTITPGNGIDITIPVTGTYFLLFRLLNPANTTMGILTVNNSLYSKSIITHSPQYAVTGGYLTPAYFFTCKIKNNRDTWLFLADNSERIRAFNDDGGITGGYSWGRASRIKTNLTNISYGLVFGSPSSLIHGPEFECDLYMGLRSPATQSTWEYHLSSYPNLPSDNSFFSGSTAGLYNCIAWSIEDMTTYYWFGNLNSFDTFYNHHGYTRDGATADNAAIALWGYDIINSNNDTVVGIEHASVRKNSKSIYPHGFEWESRLGCGGARIMHTKDALANDNSCANCYGRIKYYYRPIDGTANYSSSVSSQILESSLSAPELNRIATLKNNIPATILSNFDTKYLAWKKTWNRPEIAIHSNPFRYAQSSEYENLLAYCMKYGKAIWPLVFDKLAQKDIFVINLLRDLTYIGKQDFITEMMSSATIKTGEPFPSLYSIQVDYCKGLLAKEDGNMQKSILDISASKEEPFEVTVTVANSREIQLSLQTEKDEKAQIRIYNFSGGLELEASYNLSKGNQTLVINTSNLKKGIYVVQITIGSESVSKTVSI